MNLYIHTESEWRKQIENRLKEEGIVYEKSSVRELGKRVDALLFGEEQDAMEWIECYLFPFEQSGYLTARQKLELMLYTEEKRQWKGETGTLLSKLYAGNEQITEKEIEELYLKTRRKGVFLSREEKREFIVYRMVGWLKDDLFSILLRLGGDEILVGECCPCKDAKEQDAPERRIGIRKWGRVFRFSFLQFASEEELERSIRNQVSKEKRGEITIQSPVWQREREDGTLLYAIRPPASGYWGMKIVPGNTEGRGKVEKDRICRI